MKIVVCIKQVPDTKGGVKFNPDGTLDRGAMLAIMNPDDKAGLEAALRRGTWLSGPRSHSGGQPSSEACRSSAVRENRIPSKPVDQGEVQTKIHRGYSINSQFTFLTSHIGHAVLTKLGAAL